MKLKNPLLAVRDMARSKAFYHDVLGLRVTMDLGANAVLTGGLSLQTQESWLTFLQREDSALSYGGNDGELYFEEDDFDAFVAKLSARDDIHYVHPVIEHRWGQRAVRFYDPDLHIIEVGENIKAVCRRFLDGGMTPEETALRMDVPITFVRMCAKQK